ncbi:hypothetical protein ACHQM5_024696 [Ranunculus cassubicifolius]
MSAGGCPSKCSKIRHIVRLRQMLKRWRQKAAARNGLPSDVPTGHVAITVGTSYRRYVVRAAYLNHPVFKRLLVQAEEEYEFACSGPLTIPCDEFVFEEILQYISRFGSSESKNFRFLNFEDFQRHYVRTSIDFWPESRPLLHGFSEKAIW